MKQDNTEIISLSDIYDATAWMAIAVLTEEPIQKGGVPVYFPDFTNNK